MNIFTSIKQIALFGVISASLMACVKKPQAINDQQAANMEWLNGGSQTVFDQGVGAFGHPFPNMSAHYATIHEVGDATFEALHVPAPAPVNPGLGPIFNANSCGNCHVGDGHGTPPGTGEKMVSFFLRISIPGADAHGGPVPVPGYGTQLQEHAIYGFQPEANVSITYTYQTDAFDDGTTYQLRVPHYTITNSYTTLPSNLLISPRVAPAVFGLGLIQAVPASYFIDLAQKQAAEGVVSGKPNMVWSLADKKMELGRFGWKALTPSLLEQTIGGFGDDMGVTNFLFPKESSTGQPQDNNLENKKEISDSLVYAVAFYLKTLAVPARRNVNDPKIMRGKDLFTMAKCANCHIPTMQTGVHVEFPAISNQTIHPYSDMLLHDMGAGLADGRPVYSATGSEWRTPPLWGIGLRQIVNGNENYLHDGRARTLMEAIMWHGGEAEQSKNYVKSLSKSDRDALVAFLKSL